MVTMNLSRRYWANPVDLSSFTNSKNADETFHGRPGGPVVCFICKVYIPRVPNSRKKEIMLEHKSSGRHVQTLKIVKHNSICVDYSSKDVQLLCKICNRNLDFSEHVAVHVKDARHRAWLEEIYGVCFLRTLLVNVNVISIEKFLACSSEFAFCNICNLEIECTLQKIIMHITEKSHRKQFLDVLLPYSGVFPIEDNKVMWCKVCDLRMNNHFEDVLIHLCGNQAHGQWFHDIEMKRQQDISSMDFLTNVDEMRVLCTRCDLKLRIDFRNITTHVHSETHRLRHRGNNFKLVKSLDDHGFWPLWCHWNFFDVLPRAITDTNWVVHNVY